MKSNSYYLATVLCAAVAGLIGLIVWLAPSTDPTWRTRPQPSLLSEFVTPDARPDIARPISLAAIGLRASGIEAARWFRWYRSRGERPVSARSMLLLIIITTFTTGAVIGALVTYRASRWAMVAPAIAILAASVYALLDGRRTRTG